jgi:hypothetical protein
MPFTLDAFIARRPFLYHFTAVENLGGIRQLHRLDSAVMLAQKSERFDPFKQRKSAEEIGPGVWLQTQRPLYEKNICFEGGWVMADLLAQLNSLVFFGLVPKRDPFLMVAGIETGISGLPSPFRYASTHANYLNSPTRYLFCFVDTIQGRLDA